MFLLVVLIWMMMTDDDVLLLLLLMGCQRKLQEGRKIKRGIIFVKPKQSEKFRVFQNNLKKYYSDCLIKNNLRNTLKKFRVLSMCKIIKR